MDKKQTFHILARFLTFCYEHVWIPRSAAQQNLYLIGQFYFHLKKYHFSEIWKYETFTTFHSTSVNRNFSATLLISLTASHWLVASDIFQGYQGLIGTCLMISVVLTFIQSGPGNYYIRLHSKLSDRQGNKMFTFKFVIHIQIIKLQLFYEFTSM